jgi:stage II sporulation protein D
MLAMLAEAGHLGGSMLRIAVARGACLCLVLPLSIAIVSCGEPITTSPESLARFNLTGADWSGEVIIHDEEWIDRTIEETPVASQAHAAQTLALAPEPSIRVGVVYAELGALSIRMGGRDDGDTYALRRGTATGPVLVTGLAGEVVATIVGGGSTAEVRLSLPGGTTINSSDAVAVSSASGFVRLRRSTTDQSTYRGTAEVRFNATRTRLVGVNELPIEEYLYGVVPRELGPIAFPLVEALKAQAVAARTFARRRMQFCGASRCGHGYHVIPTTSDQVYGGFNAEHPLSTSAVSETRGIVATYGSALIEGLYSSTSGGWTANSEDVFLNALAYLRGVPDHERGAALAHVPSLDVFRRHANPTNLRNHANGDFEADWSIYHRWYVRWTVEEMRQVVGRVQLPSGVSFIDPGHVYAIEAVSRSSSGRIFELHIVTANRGTLVARKDAVRSTLRYVTYTSGGAMVLNSLRSTLVYVEPITDPRTKAIVGWEAWGGGWGHGVGMSQTGAVGMAEKGRTYPEILGHYYQDAVLEGRWE